MESARYSCLISRVRKRPQGYVLTPNLGRHLLPKTIAASIAVSACVAAVHNFVVRLWVQVLRLNRLTRLSLQIEDKGTQMVAGALQQICDGGILVTYAWESSRTHLPLVAIM